MECKECYRYNFTDDQNQFLFTESIGCDSSGKVIAQYFNKNGYQFYAEKIGKINLDYNNTRNNNPEQEIKEIAQRHFVNVQKTLEMSLEIFFKQFHPENSDVETSLLPLAISTGIFAECRSKLSANAKMFIKLLKQKKLYDHTLRLNIEHNLLENGGANWCPISLPDDDKIIRDYEWSLEALVARLLALNPYSKIPYPSLKELFDVTFEARKLRFEYITLATTKDYEFYYDGKIIFKKTSAGYHFYEDSLSCFKKIIQQLSDADKISWLQLIEEIDSVWRSRISLDPVLRENNPTQGPYIDECFIENAINKQYIPLHSLKKITKFEGLSMADAIIEAKVSGNVKRRREIENTETNLLDPLDKFLFNSIFHMCLGYEYFSSPRKEWNKLSVTYECLAGNENLPIEQKKAQSWLKLKTIHDYLSNSNNIDIYSLNLNSKNANDILRITKMFDLSLSLINSRPCVTKIAFKRNSGELRKSIVELFSTVSSTQAFSKTLFLERLNDPRVPEYLFDSKNWIDSRVGLHAKLYANAFILAFSLSKEISLNRVIEVGANNLVGARGNTASEKSTALGNLLGILNTDPIKKELRIGTNFRNHQVHVEGAMIFDLCFNEIKKHTALRYIVDLRLIRLKDIKRYLITPAKNNKCTVIMSDFDVPLVTTLVRVLNRNPRGKDPIPSLQVMVDGFKALRRKRAKVVKALEAEEVVEGYVLYFQGKIVGKKKNGKMIQIDPLGYKKCFQIPSDNEIEDCLESIIDNDFIDKASERNDLRSNDYAFLDTWKGKSLREALQRHADS